MAELDGIRDLDRLLKRIDRLPETMQGYVYGALCEGAARALMPSLRATTAFKDRTGRTRRALRVERIGYRYRTLDGTPKNVPRSKARIHMGIAAFFIHRGTSKGIKATKFATKLINRNRSSMLRRGVSAAKIQFMNAVRSLRGLV